MTTFEHYLKLAVDERWQPAKMTLAPWAFTRPRCVECGYVSRPMTATCELCGEVLNASN